MPKYLTEAKFEEYMTNLQTDLQAVENRLSTKMDTSFGAATKGMRTDIATMVTNLDAYLKRTEDWHQEQTVLRHRVGRLETTLIRKNVLGQNDLQ